MCPSSRRNAAAASPAACLLAAACLLVAGCQQHPPRPAATPRPAEPPRISDIDLRSIKPNEAGSIMILMYHRFNPDEPDSDLNRKPDTFRKDLEALYKRKYHPVTVLELVENRLDVPAGKTPVVLTFDDALPSQFRVVIGSDGQPHIDPDCAVGILETFSKKHPDWPAKGTFFVLPKEGRNGDPFGQPEHVASKLSYLVKHGFEIANHTSTHSSLRRMPPEKIQWELATAVQKIQAIEPRATMKTMALPYGHVPRKGAQCLRAGKSGGVAYENRAVLKAAWRPCLSPITRAARSLERQPNFCVFDPYALERSVPDGRRARMAGTFEYWLKWFDEHPAERYVSDGNPRVAAVPESLKDRVDPARVKKHGLVLQLYSPYGRAGGSGGGELSVQ